MRKNQFDMTDDAKEDFLLVRSVVTQMVNHKSHKFSGRFLFVYNVLISTKGT